MNIDTIAREAINDYGIEEILYDHNIELPDLLVELHEQGKIDLFFYYPELEVFSKEDDI